MIQQLWHQLTRERHASWTPKQCSVWSHWEPYLGFNFDFSTHITLPHTAVPNAVDDYSWGPEFRLSASLLWLDFQLTIPNDEHPDNDFEQPPTYCHCGAESTARVVPSCVDCGEVEVICSCIPTVIHIVDDE